MRAQLKNASVLFEPDGLDGAGIEWLKVDGLRRRLDINPMGKSPLPLTSTLSRACLFQLPSHRAFPRAWFAQIDAQRR